LAHHNYIKKLWCEKNPNHDVLELLDGFCHFTIIITGAPAMLRADIVFGGFGRLSVCPQKNLDNYWSKLDVT